MIKQFVKRVTRAAGFDVSRLPRETADLPSRDIPDAELYRPLYSPWLSPAFGAEYAKIAPFTLVSDVRCYVLASLATQASRLDGEIWECGVYKGGTAMLLAERLSMASRTLRLFDTFAGMPDTDAARDLHKAGDFSDTTLEDVQARVNRDFVRFHKGLIPDTFRGLEAVQIALAHVDVDIYSAISACCEFIFPRLCVGGFMLFDDYGFPTCPGARSAVDQFFLESGAVPLVLPTGQAIVFRSIAQSAIV